MRLKSKFFNKYKKDTAVKELIIGCTMESMIFSEERNIPMVYIDVEQPHFFEDASVKEFAEICFYLSLHQIEQS